MKQVGSLVTLLKKGENAATRHFNPYVEEALAYQELLTSDDLSSSFPNIFEDNSKELIIEIGCYLGKNLLEFATTRPDINFLGLEITYKRAVSTARKINRNELKNAKVALADALSFLKSAPAHSCNGFCVFFPDPWPKKRQAKNRLMREEFFIQLKRVLVPNGFLWFKTDATSYFEETLEAAKQVGWSDPELEVVPTQLQSLQSTTVFEELFLRKGLTPHRCLFRNHSEFATQTGVSS